MSIDINKIFNMNEIDFCGFSKQGYKQISENVGIKTLGNDWFEMSGTLADLRSSNAWKIACHEYMMQQLAWENGLAPEPLALNSALKTYSHFECVDYSPCFKMEHIDAVMLDRATCDSIRMLSRWQKDIIQLSLHVRLQQIGICHGDLHSQNILLTFDENNNIKRVYAIDYESSNTIEYVNLETAKKIAVESFTTSFARPNFKNKKKWLEMSGFLGDNLDWYGPEFREVQEKLLDVA